MDQWVTDKFYSHFPSYSGEKSRRKILDKDRQDEYNHYLSTLAPTESALSRHCATNTQFQEERDKQLSIPNRQNERKIRRNSNEISERDSSLWNENMDLPGIFNEEIINLRNRRVAEERHYKNLQYQSDLKEQIEQKRKEIEQRKAIEIEADERLTRKVEAQLRSVRLQDEIEKAMLARRRDYISNRSDMSVSSRVMNKSPGRNRSTGRLDEFENGKENHATTNKTQDPEIYKYFTNSARDPIDLRNISFRSHPVLGNEEQMSSTMESHRCHTYPAKKDRYLDAHKQCSRCELHVNREMCNFCQQNRFLARSQYENCSAHGSRQHLCKSCYYQSIQSICACCREDICTRCNRPTKFGDHLAKMKTDAAAKQSPRRRKLSPRTTNLALPEESYEDSSDDDGGQNSKNRTSSRLSSPSKFQPNGKPYSFNIEASSMFHRSTGRAEAQIISPVDTGVDKNSNVDLKRITDEKLSKYAKNYGDMRARNTSRSKMIDMDPYPMPLLSHQNTNRKSSEPNADRVSESGSVAFKQLESRWQIPFTQRTTAATDDNDKQICVLTQSGAFKKQLQMDKFNFGFNQSDDDESLNK